MSSETLISSFMEGIAFLPGKFSSNLGRMLKNDPGDAKTPSRLMAEKGPPLAKLSMPRLARGMARPRLFTFLDQVRENAAVWIAAPGGAGKTTLAATYLLERRLPNIWYQLDEDDADPATFFYYLGIAAQHASPGGEIFLPLLTPEYLSDIPGFARRYFRAFFAALPLGTALVLDNYQDLGDGAIFSEMVRAAIGEIPAGINLLVISRNDPPPELARHWATGELTILDWNMIRLTQDETEAIAADSQVLDKTVVQDLHRRTEGWPAGVTLLLEQIKRRGAADWTTDAGSLETVFHFFASEFFNDLSEITRDFLVRTALLSHMTPTLAAALSGNQEAGQILADFHRRHFFTYRRDLGEVSYQYHALFREFLMAKAAEIYTREQYLALIRLAGGLLTERERYEEAVVLHLQAEDWETAIPLLLGQAPRLLAQGRAQILAGWLRRIPEGLLKSVPWLLFWKGMSQQFVDPFTARTILEEAHTEFVRTGDVMGQMLAASALIDIAYLVRQGATSVIAWIRMLQKHLEMEPVFPSPAMEARVLTSLVAMLMFTWPEDDHLPKYAERLTVLLDAEMDVNQKIFMAGHLLYYTSLIAGDRELGERIIVRVMPLQNSPQLTVVNQIFWRHMCLLPYFLAGETDAAYKIVRPVLGLVKENNLHFLEFISNVYEVLVHLQMGAVGVAHSISERLYALLSAEQPLDVAWFHWIAGWVALMRGDHTLVLSHGLAARNDFSRFSSPTCEAEILCLLANERCESAAPTEALDYLATVRRLEYANTPRLLHQILFIESYAFLNQGARHKCHESLRRALEIARARRYFGNFLWFPRMMTRLCAEALRAGIEVDYVRQLIRKRKLPSDDPIIEDWPWPVQIYALGQFRVMRDDQVITETKVQRKPLVLLEVLIALGGAEVNIEQVAEMLWPDAEGDAAISAFTTTVSRLRKLIGEPAILVKGGRVSLDERHCWLDARALERLFDRADKIDAEGVAAREFAESLLHLYRGPFLKGEDGEWVRQCRHRLREGFARSLANCISVMRAAGEGEQSQRLLEQVMEVDPDAMRSCRRFMAT